MKKVILLSALILTLVSCSAPAPTEEVVVVDSTCVVVDSTCVVAVDSACAVTCDSTKVDTTEVK